MVFDLISTACHGATAGESSLSSDGVETRKHAIFCLAWRPTNKQGLSIALQGDVAGLGRNESTPLAHARVCLVCVPKSMQWNLELGTWKSIEVDTELATLNLETLQVSASTTLPGV
jgi:hypothetical protein